MRRGPNPFGPRTIGSYIRMNALHIIHTDTGLWLAICLTYDRQREYNAVSFILSILYRLLYIFNIIKYKAGRSIRDVLQGSCYLSRDDHDRKIRGRKQRTDIGKYCCVNRTIELWRQLPAERWRLSPANHKFLEGSLGNWL